MHELLPDLAVTIIAATLVGVITQRLGQPIILGYLLTGAIIGPEIGSPLVTDPENIEIISEIGLVLLLFVIGLEMNPRHLLASGRQLLMAGIGQFLLCVLLGLGVFSLAGYALGGGSLDAFYLALLCALSSTAIVVKALYDKNELDTLPGRMTVGILIFQDLWAILILSLQPSFLDPRLPLVGLAILKSAGLLGVSLLFSRYVLKPVYAWNTRSPEMVVAISIGWCAALAGLAGWMGLSLEMGALLAGLAISSFPYSIHVTSELLPLRDFFLTLYFISLGMKIPVPQLAFAGPVALIVIVILVSRFATVMPLLLVSGSGRRTAFITSLNLAQVSEFSLVIAALGVGHGHIPRDILSLGLYAMAVTSILSSYLIKYSHPIYVRTVGHGRAEERQRDLPGGGGAREGARPIVLLGIHRGARVLIDTLARRDPALLQQVQVVDFSLEVLRPLESLGIRTVFGDIGRLDTLRHAGLEQARIILSTIPDTLLRGTDNLKIVRACRTLAPHATLVATAESTAQADALKAAGANEIILPYSLAGEHVAGRVMALWKLTESGSE